MMTKEEINKMFGDDFKEQPLDLDNLIEISEYPSWVYSPTKSEILNFIHLFFDVIAGDPDLSSYRFQENIILYLVCSWRPKYTWPHLYANEKYRPLILFINRAARHVEVDFGKGHDHLAKVIHKSLQKFLARERYVEISDVEEPVSPLKALTARVEQITQRPRVECPRREARPVVVEKQIMEEHDALWLMLHENYFDGHVGVRYDDKTMVFPPNESNLFDHLAWMMDNFEDKARHDPKKANRWIGFIQGCIFASGGTTLDEIIQDTRNTLDNRSK